MERMLSLVARLWWAVALTAGLVLYAPFAAVSALYRLLPR